MQRLKIKRTDFELAFEISSDDASAYLDKKTGDVLYVEHDILHLLDDILTEEDTLESVLPKIQEQEDIPEWQHTQIMDTLRVEWDKEGRYLQIPKQDSREGYRDMQAFIASLTDVHLQELLETAIQGSGAFRRFKNIIARYPEVESNWFKFRDEREKERMIDWLKSEGLDAEFE